MAPNAKTKPATRRVALYLRVSTENGQTTENQAMELEAVAEYCGWEVVQVYKEEGISEAKGRGCAVIRMPRAGSLT